jgi:hypothetical protein
VNLIGYEPGRVVSESFALTAIANRHLKGYAPYVEQLHLPNKMQCCSFLIEVNGKTLFYSSDIAGLDDVKKHFDGRDYVILESTHIELEEFFEFAQTIRVGRYILTHLGTDDEVKEIIKGAQKAGLDNLMTATDGMQLPL